MDLIHKILHYVRANGNCIPLKDPEFQDYSAEQIRYHIKLCNEAGFVHLDEGAIGRRRRLVSFI